MIKNQEKVMATSLLKDLEIARATAHEEEDQAMDAWVDAVYERHLAEEAQMKADLGDYVRVYQKALSLLNDRLRVQADREREDLYNTYRNRWSLYQMKCMLNDKAASNYVGRAA